MAPAIARAHISISSGAAAANTTQEVSFSVGHGCEGSDTLKVRVQIPAGITSVRPMPNDFGKASIEKDAAGLVTAVIWQKADADLYAADIAYYKLIIRLKTPDMPFTTLYFPIEQTCKSADGGVTTVNWSMLPGAAAADGGVADEPAAELNIAPARVAGWNKLKTAVAVTELKRFFGDAQIVWKGAAAYSANAATTDLIKATAGVTPLTSLAAGDEIWVKY
jgi:uncharacterized protein YcnI